MSEEVTITWDFLSPRNERWLEWYENGKRHLKRVTEEVYQAILARTSRNDARTIVADEDEFLQ